MSKKITTTKSVSFLDDVRERETQICPECKLPIDEGKCPCDITWKKQKDGTYKGTYKIPREGGDLTESLKELEDRVKKERPKFMDIPQITQANYKVNVTWRYLKINLEAYKRDNKLELRPDFQRAHVWTEEQQIRYVEWILRGGRSGREILFNCAGWMRRMDGKMQLVDGLQRITAVQRFLNNEIKAFGYYLSEYADKLPLLGCDFVFYVNDLETRKEVLQWYLDINSGGTVHTEKELKKVRKMLEEEGE